MEQDKIKIRLNEKFTSKSCSIDTGNELLDVVISNILINVTSDLLKTISIDYKIDLTELKEKYLAEFLPNKFYNLLICKLLNITRDTHLKLLDVHSNNSIIIEDLDKSKCLARVQHGKQCTRNKKNNEFCGSHISNLPYGRIDDPVDSSDSIKKRGRPKGISKKIDVIEQNYEIIEMGNDKCYILNISSGKLYNLPDRENLSSDDDSEINIDDLIEVGIKVGDNITFY